jgi:pimeloyl-ACP methyl ester carboxylesterase
LYFARGLRVLTFFCRAFTTAYQCYTPVRAWDILDKKRAFPVWLYGRALKISLPLQDWERNPFPYKAWYPGSFDRDVLQERLSLGFDRTSLELMKFMVMWAGLGKLPDAGEHKVVENNLSRFEMPALFLGGMEDCLVPQESMRPAYDLMASSDKTWLMLGGEGSRVHWGHLDLILGREAPRRVWPLMTRWMLDRA